MSASRAAVAPSSALESGSSLAARREASSARCCSELRSAPDSGWAENTSLASTRSRRVDSPSRVTAVRRSEMIRPLLKNAELDNCSTFAAMAGSAATSLATSAVLVSSSCSSAWVRDRYRCGGEGSFSIRPMALRRRGLSSSSRSSSRLVSASSSTSGASGIGRKRWATPIRRAGGGRLPCSASTSAMRMVSGRSVRIWPSSVVALRSGNCGHTITASTGEPATMPMALWPSAAVSGCHSSPRSAMNSNSSADRLASSPTSRMRTTRSPG